MDLFNLDIQQLVCLGIIIFSIITCVRKVVYSRDLNEAVDPILSGCSTIVTFFIILSYYEKFDIMVGNLLAQVFQNSIRDNGIVHVILLVGIFAVVKFIIYSVLKLVHSFSLNSALNKLRHNSPFLIIFSIIFGFIRGIIFIVLICIPLVLYNNLVSSSYRVGILDGLKPYDKLEEMVDSKKVQVISNGLKENISSNKIIYYNGITLDEGVKSNASIDNKAKALVSRDTSDRGKARSIYRWVGSNVIYDDEKADSIMENTSSFESGAIPTFRDKRGICFDYACLYTAMCNAIGLKNRIIVDDAYNGSEFVSHAWNQVYLEDEGKWINVDPTFYISGNYFDSSNFEETHRTKNIAGEF